MSHTRKKHTFHLCQRSRWFHCKVLEKTDHYLNRGHSCSAAGKLQSPDVRQQRTGLHRGEKGGRERGDFLQTLQTSVSRLPLSVQQSALSHQTSPLLSSRSLGKMKPIFSPHRPSSCEEALPGAPWLAQPSFSMATPWPSPCPQRAPVASS